MLRDVNITSSDHDSRWTPLSVRQLLLVHLHYTEIRRSGVPPALSRTIAVDY